MMLFPKPRYIGSFARGLFLKARNGHRLKYDVFRTYFGPGFDLEIVGGGMLIIESGKGRVYFDKNCYVRCSNGVLKIEHGVFFNRGCNIVSHVGIDIGADCMFGPNVSIYDSDHVFSDPSKPFRNQGYAKAPVRIGGNCWIGTNSVVTKGTVIGSNTVVGANSVVRGTMEDSALYAGQPAKMIRSLKQKN